MQHGVFVVHGGLVVRHGVFVVHGGLVVQQGTFFVHGGLVVQHGGFFVHGGFVVVQGFELHGLGVHLGAVMTTGSAEQPLVAPLLLASPE